MLSRTLRRSSSILASATLLWLGACSRSQATSDVHASLASAPDPAPAAAVLQDAPLPESAQKLLALASRAARSLPLQPHIKNRSRLQADVVEACLKLSQPQRARSEVEAIGEQSWRRGAGFADLALYLARHGQAQQAQPFLERAERLAEAGEATITQDWQKHRIRARLAQVLDALGRHDEALRCAAGLDKSEAGAIDAQRARELAPDEFDAALAELDGRVATGDFDLRRNALGTCASLHARFYADVSRRTRLEQRIRDSWEKLPIEVRLDTLTELIENALQHADGTHALALIAEAHAIFEAVPWLAENQIPLLARFAALRHRAGEAAAARIELDAARQVFDDKRAAIVDIYRASALRALAEAYQTVGDAPTALGVYRLAVVAGVENPNSRPRAEDLCASCCSMAVHGVEPDAELWKRLDSIVAGLGDPW